MELTITKEKVIAAAAKCETTKEVLQTLFPEVFEEDKSVKITEEEVDSFLWIRSSAEYSEKGFTLTEFYNWELKRDSLRDLVLIPTRK